MSPTWTGLCGFRVCLGEHGGDHAALVVVQVAALLEGGMTQRALAAQWINVRTGKPYSVMHVNYTKQALIKLTLQPRPRFRDAYNEVANAKPPLPKEILDFRLTLP